MTVRTVAVATADKWKEELLGEKGIPIMRQWCRAPYDMQALRATIDNMVRPDLQQDI
jgi:hypothetical protein